MAEFYKNKLNSGATVFLEKRELPVVSILVATRAGAAYETEKQKGLAHFVEHMLYKGSKKRSSFQISSDIEKIGGILNGFTSEQITGFWAKVPSKFFEIGCDVLFDMVANPLFKVNDINMERNVIIQEIKMYEDNPQAFIFNKLKEELFAKPFGINIAGSVKTVSSFKQEDFKKWHDSFLGKNLIISVVGNANFKTLIDKSKEYFDKKVNVKDYILKPVLKNGNFVKSRKDLEQTHLALGFHIPSLSSGYEATIDVLNAILGDGMSSRLFQEVREKKGLAYSIKSMPDQEKDFGYLTIYAGTEKAKWKLAKQIILKEIKKMQTIPLKEFEQAKERCIGKRNVENESSNNVATTLAFQEIVHSTDDYYKYTENVNNVKLADVKKLIKIKNYSSALLLPENK